MIAITHSAIPLGYDAQIVTIESDSARSLPAFNIVGMATRTVSEAKDRVRSALKSSGFDFPARKITVNLAPADLTKNTTSLDLPIAISILLIAGHLKPSDTAGRFFVGELSLDGSLRPVKGIINIIESAKFHGFKEVYLPPANLQTAALIDDITLIPTPNLRALHLHLRGLKPLPSASPAVVKNTKTLAETSNPALFDSILGQSRAKRALTIAIAGHHNLLLSGPPGAGKTLLARAAATLLPPLSSAEQISLTKLYSLSTPLEGIITSRPFRAPHHSSSQISIIGGGSHALPGEISLAHTGILFLDELPEYPRSTLEALRQPLEDRQISISRAHSKVIYPANFMLIATMNPCPCGHLGDPNIPCICTGAQIDHYQKKLSGPLLDRIDLIVNVKKVPTANLLPVQKSPQTTHTLSTFSVVKNTITDAIKRQHRRYNDQLTFNSSLSSASVAKFIKLSPKAASLIKSASDSLNLSARSFFKTIKVARTIADLAGSRDVEDSHIAEALTYRERPPRA